MCSQFHRDPEGGRVTGIKAPNPPPPTPLKGPHDSSWKAKPALPRRHQQGRRGDAHERRVYQMLASQSVTIIITTVIVTIAS